MMTISNAHDVYMHFITRLESDCTIGSSDAGWRCSRQPLLVSPPAAPECAADAPAAALAPQGHLRQWTQLQERHGERLPTLLLSLEVLKYLLTTLPAAPTPAESHPRLAPALQWHQASV
jgi:hypothetical protein